MATVVIEQPTCHRDMIPRFDVQYLLVFGHGVDISTALVFRLLPGIVEAESVSRVLRQLRRSDIWSSHQQLQATTNSLACAMGACAGSVENSMCLDLGFKCC